MKSFSFFSWQKNAQKAIYRRKNTDFCKTLLVSFANILWAHSKLVGTPCRYYHAEEEWHRHFSTAALLDYSSRQFKNLTREILLCWPWKEGLAHLIKKKKFITEGRCPVCIVSDRFWGGKNFLWKRKLFSKNRHPNVPKNAHISLFEQRYAHNKVMGPSRRHSFLRSLTLSTPPPPHLYFDDASRVEEYYKW